MNLQEMKKVLTKIQIVDNRQVDEMIVAEWFDVIGYLDFADTIAAVREHRRTSTEYLTPAHLAKIVSRYGKERAEKRENVFGFIYTTEECPHLWGGDDCALCGAFRVEGKIVDRASEYLALSVTADARKVTDLVDGLAANLVTGDARRHQTGENTSKTDRNTGREILSPQMDAQGVL